MQLLVCCKVMPYTHKHLKEKGKLPVYISMQELYEVQFSECKPLAHVHMTY